MSNITEPLRLAVGSHSAGSGVGCAMNVISWENGDTHITDFPDCVMQPLAYFVQWLNDIYCTHRENHLLCALCSIKVLDLAHKTIGTDKFYAPLMLDQRIEAVLLRQRMHDIKIDPRPDVMYSILEGVIDDIWKLYGGEPTIPDEDVVAEAIQKMMVKV